MIRPLLDRIVVEQQDDTQTSNSLIYIPDTATKTQTRGKVVAVGPGRYEKGKQIPCTVMVGDTVIFPKGTGAPAEVNKQKYIIMHEGDIVAVVG